MTEEIKALREEVAKLRERVAVLEARPVVPNHLIPIGPAHVLPQYQIGDAPGWWKNGPTATSDGNQK